MNKLYNLRDTLLNANIGLSADNTTVMSKQGKLEHHYRRENDRGNNKFKKTYDIEIFIFNYAKDPNAVLWVVSQWLTKNQAGHKSDAISYELEILNHDECDLLITVADVTDIITAIDTEHGTTISSCPPQALDPIVRKEGVSKITSERGGDGD